MKSNTQGQIFLGKGAKIEGPFTEAEVNDLRRSGGLDSYTWIWDNLFKQWKLLHAQPPMPPMQTSSSKTSLEDSAIQVICHDRIHVLSGSLTGLHDRGCRFVPDLSQEDFGIIAFKPASVLALNLLDPKTGKAANIKATVETIKRSKDGAPVYDLEWKEIPEVLSQF